MADQPSASGSDVPPRDAPEVSITPYRDGPLLVRGPIVLHDQDGRPIDTGRGPVALCRCGKTRKAPFCDSSHKLAGFRTPAGPAAADDAARCSRSSTRP